jgi:hypothetical protein
VSYIYYAAFYILHLLCPLPRRFRLVLTVFRDEIQSAFEDPKMIRSSTRNHFYSPVLPNYILVLLSVAVFPFIILLTCSFITSFVLSILSSYLPSSIFAVSINLSFTPLSRMICMPSPFFIITFPPYCCLSAFRLQLCRQSYFRFRFLFSHHLLFHICKLFPAFTECLNAD